MKIIGVELRKPKFVEITKAALVATGLWAAYVALWQAGGGVLDPLDAGATLLVLFWGCACAAFGIRIERGLPHLALNVVCTAALLGLYQFFALGFSFLA